MRLLRGACPERDSSVALLPQNDKGKLGVRMTESEGLAMTGEGWQ